MTKRASPSPPTRMRATTASRHVARTFSGKPDVMIDHYNLPEHITPPCSLWRFTFFKDRNKLADATRSGSMAACMRCSVRCWRPKRAYLLSEQAPMKLRCRMRWRKAVLKCALVALTLRFGSHSPSSFWTWLTREVSLGAPPPPFFWGHFLRWNNKFHSKCDHEIWWSRLRLSFDMLASIIGANLDSRAEDANFKGVFFVCTCWLNFPLRAQFLCRDDKFKTK